MQCRICIDSSSAESMLTPCNCSGTMKYVHKECLLRWVNASHKSERCDVCLSQYNCRFVAIRPNFCQLMRFLANNANIFLFALMVTLQFLVGVFSSFYGLSLNAKRVSHCLRAGSLSQSVLLCLTSICLTATLIANVFWFFIFCRILTEVVADNWRENIVYTLEE